MPERDMQPGLPNIDQKSICLFKGQLLQQILLLQKGEGEPWVRRRYDVVSFQANARASVP
jgi:hypothetical protein